LFVPVKITLVFLSYFTRYYLVWFFFEILLEAHEHIRKMSASPLFSQRFQGCLYCLIFDFQGSWPALMSKLVYYTTPVTERQAFFQTFSFLFLKIVKSHFPVRLFDRANIAASIIQPALFLPTSIM